MEVLYVGEGEIEREGMRGRRERDMEGEKECEGEKGREGVFYGLHLVPHSNSVLSDSGF